MSTEDLLAALVEQVGILVDGVQAVMENQQLLVARLDEHSASLAAIGVAVGMTYLATGDAANKPLPTDVLEDPAFARFLEIYPIDGPPITGQGPMDAHLASLEKIDPARMAAGFRDLAEQSNLSRIDRVRIQQIERIARERLSDFAAIERMQRGEPNLAREADR